MNRVLKAPVISQPKVVQKKLKPPSSVPRTVAKKPGAVTQPKIVEQKKHRGNKKIDPAVLAARGSYRLNPSRAPEEYRAKKSGARQPDANKDYVAIGEQYAHDVIAGKILTCALVKMACARHIRERDRETADNFPYYYDAAAANKFCSDAEQYPHIKGRWAQRKENITLQPWQCFALVVPFGWKRKKDKFRRFREMYIEVPRKNAKSTIAAIIGINMMVADNEHGAEVYAGATSEKQAWEVFGPARLMMERSAHLRGKYGVEVWAKALLKTEDNSKFWPIIGNPGDGSSPHCAIIDEYHEHITSSLLDTMVTGMGSREQPMVVVITTAGVDLGVPCYDKHLEAKKVLTGVLENDELFALIYSIDSGDTENPVGDDWTSIDAIRKANPNLNVSADESFLLAQQRQAMTNPAYQNRFKTKHLNMWCAASVAGINMHSWRLCTDQKMSLNDFTDEQAWFSLDLASKTDICSFVKLFKRVIEGETHYYVFAKNYLPEDTIEEATHHRESYQRWVIQQHLTATPGAEIDFDIVRDDVLLDATKFVVEEIVYDPWRATQLAHQIAKQGAKIVEMAQTTKNMGEAFDEFLSAIKSKRFHHTGCPILEWMASNVIAKEVTKGLVVPSKQKREQKIDAIVAIVMAVSRAMVVEVGGWLADPITAG